MTYSGSLTVRFHSLEGEALPPEPKDVAHIRCPFCNAPWSEENLDFYNLDAGDHCESGRFYAECVDIEITCHSCRRLMYRKQGREIR